MGVCIGYIDTEIWFVYIYMHSVQWNTIYLIIYLIIRLHITLKVCTNTFV